MDPECSDRHLFSFIYNFLDTRLQLPEGEKKEELREKDAWVKVTADNLNWRSFFSSLKLFKTWGFDLECF